MDHLDPKNYTCTEPINVKQYFNLLAAKVDASYLNDRSDQNLFGLAISLEQLNTLEGACNVAQLDFPGEYERTVNTSKVHRLGRVSPVGEHSIHNLKIRKVKEEWEQHHVKRHVRSLPAPRNDEEIYDEDLTPNKDVVVIVRIFTPFHNSKRWEKHLKYTNEVAMLGTHTLAQLRDMIKCINDSFSMVEIQHPDEEYIQNPKEEYPSGFFFIENCFYNDMRHPKAIKYSREFMEWAKDKSHMNSTEGCMENTCIQDLKLRLGYPYMYQHQGNCQHLLMFTDMRLLRADEQRVSYRYPYTLSYNRFRRHVCCMCKDMYASFLITECDRLVNNNNYMCRHCVLLYNYRDGEKMGSFRLFPYHDFTLTMK